MAAPVAPIMGANCVFCLNSGTIETPVWTEMNNVRDLEPSVSFSGVDITARFGGGFKVHEPALADLSFSTEHLYDPADIQLDVLRTSALARILVDVAIMDGPIDEDGSQGYRVQVKAHSHKRSEKVDGILSESFDWKPCYSVQAPQYYIVGAV